MKSSQSVFFVILLLVAALLILRFGVDSVGRVDVPGTFRETGYITLNNPGQNPGVLYFIYDTPGAPANTMPLHFITESVCTTVATSTLCADMNVYETYENQSVHVSGQIRHGRVEVSFVSSTQANGLSDTQEPTLVDWEMAENFIRTCRVDQVAQYHSLDVFLTLNDGRILKTVQPVIDQVLDLVQTYTGACGTIPILTE